MTIKIGISLLVLILGMLVTRPLVAEQMSIDKQTKLSPEHRVMPYHIARLSDGDLLIFGSNDQLDYRPWATRVSSTGQVRWEFLQGGSDGWNDKSQKGQRYDSLIEFRDGSILLCGTKIADRERMVLLDHLRADGTLVEERTLEPDKSKGQLESADCISQGDGVALSGAVSADPAGTGWLAKLDWHLDLQWEKFGDEYVGGDMMPAPDYAFYYLNGSTKEARARSSVSVMKLGLSGSPSVLHTFDSNEIPTFVYPDVPRADLSFYVQGGTLDSKIVEFDNPLRSPTRVIKLHNAGMRKCLQLPDRSMAIFGSQYLNGATAAVTRLYTTGIYKTFLVEPTYQSGWYYDAVFLGGDRQFAATRLVDDGRAVLDWVSFK